MSSGKSFNVLIAGGGAAGITVAASLKRRAKQPLSIAIIEPSDAHYYQPALTLVGAGAYALARTRRSEASLIPRGVEWIQEGVKAFQPDDNTVELGSGERIGYDYLVVCTGIELNWEKIEGLIETLGKNGVCSNYAPDQAQYTWTCVQGLKSGAKAVFTQPPMPFKCPGAPQKIAYLTADHLRKKGALDESELTFLTATPAIFGVPYFAQRLNKVAAGYGIDVRTQHNLVAVDGTNKKATFAATKEDGATEEINLDFDMLHVTPPQSPAGFVKESPLANEAGYVAVDDNSLQHTKYENVFALGDVCSTPNSKTAAAVRKQAPVVVRNILHLVKGGTLDTDYDGYASCPLTTAYGKVILAEFVYGGKVTPTFPFDPGKERWSMWWVKVTGLPLLYWHYMLKGYEWFLGHDTDWKGDQG